MPSLPMQMDITSLQGDAPAAPSRRRMGIVFAALSGTLILSAAGVYLSYPGKKQTPFTPEMVAEQFCVPLAPEAVVGSGEAVTVSLDVSVPNVPPLVEGSGRTVRVKRGDVVRMLVASDADGAVGVHGLSSIDAVRRGEVAKLAFRAIYAGRFPLHFHGVDGSHYELVSLEIEETSAYPESKPDNAR